mmetsp:Transcript_28531/g.61315  ORF Transcript_28531/g.61315 Transcript_28531/m.61315 type:complete len:265 (+) Transcript_28531:431-1225(+)
MTMSRSHPGRSRAVLTWNSLGMLPRKRTMVGFTYGPPHASQTMGEDSLGASASSPLMSLTFDRTPSQNSSKSTARPQCSQAAAPIEPWTLTTISRGRSVHCASRPSMFCVYSLVSLPSLECRSSTTRWASVAFHCFSYVPSMKLRFSSNMGRGFCKNMTLSNANVGSSSINARSNSLAVNSSGRNVSYNPTPADRKSGIPLDTDMPAPANTTTDRHSGDLRKSATPRGKDGGPSGNDGGSSGDVVANRCRAASEGSNVVSWRAR